MVLALEEMKTGTSGPSDVSLELISPCWEVLIQMMLELCQRALDGLGMSAEFALCVVVSIFKVWVTFGIAFSHEL